MALFYTSLTVIIHICFCIQSDVIARITWPLQPEMKKLGQGNSRDYGLSIIKDWNKCQQIPTLKNK